MKKYFTNKFTIVGFISLILFGIIYRNNDYMEFKERRCVVLDRLTTSGGHKSSGRFYLVLREERGVVFDAIVSPTTFSQSKIGDTTYFDLREMDIKQTPMDNTIYFVGPVVFGAVAFVFLICGWVCVRHGYH